MRTIITRQRLYITAPLLLALGVSITIILNSRSQPVPFKSHIPRDSVWDLVTVSRARDFSAIKVPGQVRSNQFAIIAPRRIGIIQDLLVDVGDKVSKGQTIGSMLPEGVEGQGSAAINEASARLQRAKAELANSQGVAIDAVSVATKQWRETNLQSQTQSTLDQEAQKQLDEKKDEAVIIATQAWERTKLILFGPGKNYGTRGIIGNFSNSIQETKVLNLAEQIQQMETSGRWSNPNSAIEHLVHLENFLSQAEVLYKNAQSGVGISESQVSSNLSTIQSQQLAISRVKQEVLSLEEKALRFSSVQAEREAGVERSREALDLVQSQQNLGVTQAEKNVQVALANYNAALVRAGHQSIISPYDGEITARMVEVGQAVTPNTSLFHLDGAQTARSSEAQSEVHFSLPESWLGILNVGSEIEIKTLKGTHITGRVFRLSRTIESKTQSINGTAIPLKNEEEEGLGSHSVKSDDTADLGETLNPVALTHGQSVFVYFDDPHSQYFEVPTLSLKSRQGRFFVWQWANEAPVQIEVELLAENGEYSQVYSPELTAGDIVIGNPSVSLFNHGE